MISIVSGSTHGCKQGECEYEVKINRVLTARFIHAKADGIEVCMLKAVVAVMETTSKARQAEILSWFEDQQPNINKGE